MVESAHTGTGVGNLARLAAGEVEQAFDTAWHRRMSSDCVMGCADFQYRREAFQPHRVGFMGRACRAVAGGAKQQGVAIGGCVGGDFHTDESAAAAAVVDY